MDRPPGFKDGRPSSGGVVDTTKLCLMEMNQEELADTLWGGKRLLGLLWVYQKWFDPDKRVIILVKMKIC